VLSLKKLKESLQLKELGEEVKELLKHKNHVLESQLLKDQFDQRYHRIERKGRLEAMDFRIHQSYSSVLGQEIKKGELEVEEQELKVDQVRERVRLAHRETKSFEILKEKSFENYQKELRKEEEKELNEVGLNRARFRRSESGQALMVVMAIGSTVFLMSLLTVGLMFATGNLSAHKLTLISQIISYEKYSEDVYKVMGKDDPYIVFSDDYLAMRENAEKYIAWEKGELDNEVVITQEIFDHRKNLLERLERNIIRIRDDVKGESMGLKSREDELVTKQDMLEKRVMAFDGKVDEKKKEKMKKAQAQILQSFNAMEPEDVVNVLTGGKTPQQLTAPGELEATVEKVASYLSQMSARQRAGVLQAMAPDLATPVVQHLEGNFPL